MTNIYVGVSDVAKALDLSESTIKKYYLEIEKYHGFRFKRTINGHLSFSNKDIEMLREIIYLKNLPNMTVSLAIEEVMKNITDLDVYDERDTRVAAQPESMEELKEYIKSSFEIQQKENSLVLDKLEELTNKIEKDQEQKDLLIDNLKKEMEEKQLLMIELEEEKNKKTFLQRLFGK